MTTLGICEDNEVVAQTTQRFMKALGYRGILDIGYRYDPRDGQYKCLDVNPRVGATFRLFVGERGLDVVRALYLDLTGRPVPSDRARPGRKWVVDNVDPVSSFRYWRDGHLTVGEWARSLRGIDEAAFFDPRDLGPLVAMMLDAGRRVGRKLRRASAGRRHGPTRGLHRGLEWTEALGSPRQTDKRG